MHWIVIHILKSWIHKIGKKFHGNRFLVFTIPLMTLLYFKLHLSSYIPGNSTIIENACSNNCIFYPVEFSKYILVNAHQETQ